MTVPAVYVDLPFWLAIVFMLGGLWLLAWSANLFVDGAEAVARSFGLTDRGWIIAAVPSMAAMLKMFEP